MKKNLFLALLLVLTLLTGCGASAGGDKAEAAADMLYGADNGMAAEPQEAPAGAIEETAAEAPAEGGAEAASNAYGGVIAGEVKGSLSEKIIYSAYAEVETTEFEESVEAVYDLLDQYGGFLENSSVTGSNLSDTINGIQSNRSATFTLRVPKENYSAVTAALDTVGNVTYLTNDAENITAMYTDTESRRKAYETEEERLLEIMSKAETVEDLIDLESRLSQIRYEKENLTAQLKNWDNQVDYSSVSVTLNEVQVLTPEPPAEEPTYGQELKEGFIGSVKFMGRACKALLKLFVEAIPVLLPIGVIVLAVILICVRSKKRKEKKRELDRREEEKKPEGE